MAETTRVPKSVVRAVELIGKLSDDQFSKLNDAIARTSPSISRTRLTEDLETASGLEPETVQSVLDALVPMYIAHSTWGQDRDFAKYTARAIQNESPNDGSVNWDSVERRLSELMSHDSMSIVAKAIDISTDQLNTFCTSSARIITDVRPLFTNDPTKQPSAAVLVHTLKFSYHINGEHKEFYCGLDSDDMQHIGEAISRATEKEKSVRALLAAVGVLVLGTQGVENHG
jgi:hypothetical protein